MAQYVNNYDEMYDDNDSVRLSVSLEFCKFCIICGYQCTCGFWGTVSFMQLVKTIEAQLHLVIQMFNTGGGCLQWIVYPPIQNIAYIHTYGIPLHTTVDNLLLDELCTFQRTTHCVLDYLCGELSDAFY